MLGVLSVGGNTTMDISGDGTSVANTSISLEVTNTRLNHLASSVDQFFLIIMGMCVLFMQCGFAFLEAGAVRSKNATNILIKNVLDSFVSGVAYWLIGFGLAFGDGGIGQRFIGAKYFASSDMPDEKYAEFFFQYTFAATAATIVSGAMAERCEFVAYFAYSFFITGFIYPVVTHWAWGGGWLSMGMTYENVGTVAYQDFAGSGIVHVLGGVAAFVGAVLLGPRIGRFHSSTGIVGAIRGHSVPIAALGGFILFFGFMAFNGGSQLTITNPGDGAAVSLAVVNTIISASFAAFMTLGLNRMKFLGNSWSLLETINGALAGMVAACAGCNNMFPWEACIVGLIASLSYTFWSLLMKKLKIDDPLDAVAVHFGGGSWGVIAVAFFDKNDGIILNRSLKSAYKLAWQLIGLSSIMAWTGIISFLLFGVLKLVGKLRVPEELELKGLDLPKHNEPAYPVEAYGHGYIEKILQILETTPTEVKQGFSKVEFEQALSDHGPYENPEVQAISKNGNIHLVGMQMKITEANGNYKKDGQNTENCRL